MKVDLNDHFEFSPSSFNYFIRWFCYNPVWTLVAFMKLEVNFLNISLHVFIVVWLNVDRPLMCVSIFFSFFPKCSRNVAINNRLYFNDTLREKKLKAKLFTTHKNFSPSLFLPNPAQNQPALTEDSLFTNYSCNKCRLSIRIMCKITNICFKAFTIFNVYVLSMID